MALNEQIHLPGIPLLFLTVSDCPLTRYLEETRRLLVFKPQILDAIDSDLDQYGLSKKAARLADRRWSNDQRSLPGQDHGREGEGPDQIAPLTLKQGRPRMSAKTCYFFWMLCNHVGGIKSRDAADRIMDSKNVEAFLHAEGCSRPSFSSILENINALKEETRAMILDAQIEMAREEGLDDFQRCQVDSTAVDANTAWPTDSSLILKLVGRLRKHARKLHKLGLPLVDKACMEERIARLKSLDFQICNMSARQAKRRKEAYGQLLEEAEIAARKFHEQLEPVEHLLKTISLKPSQQNRMISTFELMSDELDDLFYAIICCSERVQREVTIPSSQKILSVSDPDAAFLKKGKRELRIGYKPQVCRSGKGLVTGIIVPRGNAADAPLLQDICSQSFERTGIVPREFSADGGYASRANRKWLLKQGVERPSFSSSKGKAITPANEWESLAYKELRRWRSAVEALMSQIKGMFGFGKVVRRTLQRVRAELMDKVLTYNFMRLNCLRV